MPDLVRPYTPLLTSFLALVVMVTAAQAQSTVSGRAVGVEANLGGIVTAPLPEVVLPPEGGSQTTIVLGVNVPTTIDSGTVTVHTEGTTGVDSATASSSSSIEDAEILLGILGLIDVATVDLIDARTTCTCDGDTATCMDDGSQLANLVITGVPIAGTPPPNTVIPLPGIGSVTLNEQITGGDGIDTAEITINMIHVQLTLPGLAGNVIVGSAHSDVSCSDAPVPTPTPTPSDPCLQGPPSNDPIVSGDATGIQATQGGMDVVGPQPHVVLPETGGGASATMLGVDVDGPGPIGTQLANAMIVDTSGDTTATTADSESNVVIQDANFQNGLIAAETITAHTSCTCDGTAATCDDTGSTISNLVIAGVVIGDITPAPNTMVVIPGVATIALNERVASGDGVDVADLTVTMIHVVLEPPLDAELIIAQSHSDVNCAPQNPPPPMPQTSVSGEAYLAWVDIPGNELPGPLTLNRSPHVVLEPGGGFAEASVLDFGLTGVLLSGTGHVETTGTAGDTSASSQSTATLESANVLDGLVTADVVTAVASCSCDGTTASCSDAGTTLLNVVVDGNPLGNDPAPNTVIPIPGVATVTLNRQTTSGDGVDVSALTIDMIHVELEEPPLGGEIIVTSAHADVDCTGAGAPGPTPDPTPTCTLQPTPSATVPTPTPTPGGPTSTPGGPTATPGGPTPTPGPTPADLNHFLCYESHSPRLRDVFVTLHDEYSQGDLVQVKRRKRFCNPVNKNGEDPTAPQDEDHLAVYQIKQKEPKFLKLRGLTLLHQFGIQSMDLKRPDMMLLPSSKSLVGPPGPLDPPMVNHFKCYKITKSRVRVEGVVVEDQFLTQMVDVKKPQRVCVPADKNGEGIPSTSPYLTCFKVKNSSGTAKFKGTDFPLFTEDQLGPLEEPVFRVVELCVPSLIGTSGS